MALTQAAPRVPAPARSPLTTRLLVLGGQALVVLSLLALVQGVVQSGLVSKLFLSEPTAVALAFGSTFTAHVLPAAAITLAEIAVSLALAAVCGMTAGYLLWRHPDAGRAYETLLNALFASPTFLLYPIALVFFGRTSTAIVAMAAGIGVIPITLSTRDALLHVNPVFIRLGRTLRLSNRQLFRTVLLPAAAPGVFAGLQIGLSYMFKVTLAMEFIVSIGGLGKLVADAFNLLDTRGVYVGIVAVVIAAIIFVSILNWIEHGLRRTR